jgi:hypothetical protein
MAMNGVGGGSFTDDGAHDGAGGQGIFHGIQQLRTGGFDNRKHHDEEGHQNGDGVGVGDQPVFRGRI